MTPTRQDWHPVAPPLPATDIDDGLLIEDNLRISEQDVHVNQDAGRIEVRRNLWSQSASPDPFVDSSKGDLPRRRLEKFSEISTGSPHTGAT